MFGWVLFEENIKYEICRKFFHISTLIFLLFYKINFWLGLVSSLFFVMMYLISEICRLMRINLPLLQHISGIMLKTREISSCKISLSPIFLVVSIFFTYYLIPEPFNYIGIFSACLGDGLASLFGKIVPSFKLVNNKTFSGSVVIFLVSFIVCYYFFPDLIVSSVVALGAVIVELFDFKKYDNLFLPVGVSIISFVVC
ncbi:diacylglycerol/polyprenol kinase family protein [Borrelia sp. RT1S]|uniref:diacylglycerol/polyprenol kinase family protein n=1 Tax=Borrelia sp. RT1S TaxID=2898580 RepID=UPI001E488D39|nr:diacylglycerol/polyprenol kinase family protein [Borrelia sp. RT1S]UGQ17206.1 SEC59/DGK1/VTE5 family protein [Borrelia sp. RT1S]